MNEPPAPIMPEAKKIDIGKARVFGENRSEIIEVAAGDRVASPIATPILQTKSHCNAVAKPAEIVSRLQAGRSEEHTSELQSLMRISYAVFCLKKNTQKPTNSPHVLTNNNATQRKLI